MLPGLDGFQVCRELRRRGIDVPVIMLTAKSDEVDRVLGLEIGADDYLVKPFSVRELIARIKVRLRRDGKGVPAPFRDVRSADARLTSITFKRVVTGCRSN